MARRQDYVTGGRPIHHRVRVTAEQEAQLKERADALGVTISKLLVDTALDAPVADSRAVFLELAGLRRRVDEVHRCFTNEAENVNAIARFAQVTGKFNAQEWDEVRDGIKNRNRKLDEMVEGWKNNSGGRF